jgi:hypothetical protein
MPSDQKRLKNRAKKASVVTATYNLTAASGDYIKTQSNDQITAQK